jgi:LysR family glycine cleavage system transcriptional activator
MPPLNALKAFEAAARHLSFTVASAELNVTQAAISHQVRTLETYLGLNLFHRSHQRLALTNAGKSYLPMLTTSFDLIGQGYKEIITDKTSTHLNIKAPSSFSVQWLLPRIADYQKQHPSIDVHLSAQDNDISFFPDAFDIEIRYLLEPCLKSGSTLLFAEEIFPVCSPALLVGPEPLLQPSDLANHKLLHINFYPEDWAMWLAHAGVTSVNSELGHRFDQSMLTLKSAIHGSGIALARSPIVNHKLANGSLVEPFNIRLSSQGGYWLTTNADLTTCPHVADFKHWLLQECHLHKAASS